MLVASSDPLDQYLVRHPEFFEGAPPEHARLHADQPLILLDHIRCAAFELPFLRGVAVDNSRAALQVAHANAARHHVAEGVDDRPGVAFQQDHPRRRDRQRQPEQGRDQQQAGETLE